MAENRRTTKSSTSTEKGASKEAPAKNAPSKRAPSASPPPRKKMTAGEVATAAGRQLLELTGRDAEGVTGLEKTDDGWRVQVEVVEIRRIPNTTDMLALYDVEVDDDGDLVGYRRVHRYSRGDSSSRE